MAAHWLTEASNPMLYTFDNFVAGDAEAGGETED